MDGSPLRVRLILVEEQTLLRSSLARVFASEQDFELVGECASCAEAAELLRTAQADVGLMGFTVFHPEDLRTDPKVRLLVIAADLDVRSYALALRNGASGIFLKSQPIERLLCATRAVARGEVWVDPRTIQLIANRFPEEEAGPAPVLSEREQKVLEGIVEGHSNRKIGEGLRLSEGSVKAVVRQLFEKHGVRTRSQLVRIACEAGVAA